MVSPSYIGNNDYQQMLDHLIQVSGAAAGYACWWLQCLWLSQPIIQVAAAMAMLAIVEYSPSYIGQW